MGQIVLGAATSHGPMLSMPPEMWPVLGDGDKHHSMLIDVSSGRPVTYEELLELADPSIAKRLTKDVFEAQHDVTQKAIATLGRKLREVAPDVVVIVSNDQDEVYFDDNMPCFSIY